MTPLSPHHIRRIVLPLGETVEVVFDHLDASVHEGAEMLVADLRRLSAANAQDAIDRFAAALEDDLILPEDF